MTTLRVRNLAQKILWDEELSGQISDGLWENATPWDHWKPWCDAEVIVDPDHVGRDFYARRQSYNFTSKDLLGVVGDRMLEYVQAVIPDYTLADMRRDLKDLKIIIKQFVSSDLPVPSQPHGLHCGAHADDSSEQLEHAATMQERNEEFERTFTFADFDTQAI